MTGLERDTLAALNGINKSLQRIADYMREHEDCADDRTQQLRNDLTAAIYAISFKPNA